jgi:plasmid stabilization system protein ParE
MKIIWSPQAKKDYWQNIDYLEAEWTFNDVVRFIEKVDETITLLSQKNVV